MINMYNVRNLDDLDRLKWSDIKQEFQLEYVEEPNNSDLEDKIELDGLDLIVYIIMKKGVYITTIVDITNYNEENLSFVWGNNPKNFYEMLSDHWQTRVDWKYEYELLLKILESAPLKIKDYGLK